MALLSLGLEAQGFTRRFDNMAFFIRRGVDAVHPTPDAFFGIPPLCSNLFVHFIMQF